MDTLFLNPGACSLAVHMLLEEIGEPFEAHVLVTGADGRLPESLEAWNPLRRVPVLRTREGVFTETTAILLHLAERYPERALFPHAPSARATHARALMSYLSTAPHPTFSHVLRPRWIDADGAERARAGALAEYACTLEHVETVLARETIWHREEGDHALGAFSVVDPYVTVFWLWARHVRIDVARYPRLGDVAKQMLARPSARRALAREGLTTRV